MTSNLMLFLSLYVMSLIASSSLGNLVWELRYVLRRYYCAGKQGLGDDVIEEKQEGLRSDFGIMYCVARDCEPEDMVYHTGVTK